MLIIYVYIFFHTAFILHSCNLLLNANEIGVNVYFKMLKKFDSKSRLSPHIYAMKNEQILSGFLTCHLMYIRKLSGASCVVKGV
jgi:hypothetical protein